MTRGTIGVLAMAYGTPRDRDDIAAYYTDIRRGRPPEPAQLEELTARYDALGGTFPLRAITAAQVAGLQRAFDAEVPGDYRVVLGQKHAAPTIEEGVAELAARGIRRAVGIVLAPHFSAFSVGQYAERALHAQPDVAVVNVESWATLPAYVDFLAAAVRAALRQLPAGSEVVFTAHSLPARILDSGDPYPMQVAATAGAVARAADLGGAWSTAWQSAGRTPEPWLGPDVLDVLRSRAAGGAPGVCICACGFTGDHLEVAYDLDIEAAAVAREAGLPFARTASMNDDPSVLCALAQTVHERAVTATW